MELCLWRSRICHRHTTTHYIIPDSGVYCQLFRNDIIPSFKGCADAQQPQRGRTIARRISHQARWDRQAAAHCPQTHGRSVWPWPHGGRVRGSGANKNAEAKRRQALLGLPGQRIFLIVRTFCPSRYSYAMLLMLFFTMKMPRPPICLSWAESVMSGSGLASGS